MARKSAAKLLAKTVETQVAVQLLKNTEEKCIKGLVKLASSTRQDGKQYIESFHDMLHVFFIISETRPGPLCRYLPDDLMEVFREISDVPDESDVTIQARSIIQMLMKDHACKKKLKSMIQRVEGSATQDLEDDLLQPWPSYGR